MVLSVQVATAAVVLSLPFAFAAAYTLTFVPLRHKVLLEVIVHLPLTLPPVVVGYALLVVFGQHGLLGARLHALGIDVVFTWKAAVLASSIVGFPLMVRAIRLAMEAIAPQVLLVARSLGASPWNTVRSVVLPLSLRGILAGGSLLFARSLGEFGATVLVAGNIPGVTRTLPLAIYDYASTPGAEDLAGLLCAVAVALSVGVLLIHERFGRALGGRI